MAEEFRDLLRTERFLCWYLMA